MKTFLIPTDFSTAANNAIEYGAKLAQKAGAKIELVNIKLSDASEVLTEPENYMYIRTTPEILEDITQSVRDNFSIPCTFVAERTSYTFQNAMKDLSFEKELIIMGTNGADDTYQYFFGTNTYHVIKNVKCPVLVVPEGKCYKPIEKVVFLWDYTINNKTAFLQMGRLLNIFHPEITLLHISKKDTQISDDVFQAIKEEIYSYSDEVMNILFDRVFCEESANYTKKLIDYVSEKNSDLLVVSNYERGLIHRIFHGRILRKLTDASLFPLLIMHV